MNSLVFPFRLLLCVGFALVARLAIADTAQLDQAFSTTDLQIATPDARLHRFRVWVAEDDQQRQRGLMFVKHMEDDQGMLFVYPETQIITMWMKNTYLSLDMVFIGPDGRVVHVAKDTKPMSLETIDSKKPASAVLELKAGMAERLRIGPGAQVMAGKQ
jgi:uncharacterized protein